MKITIGEKWHRDEPEYVEEAKVTGLESIDSEVPEGEVVLPKDGDSHIKVRMINSITAEYYHTKVKLRHLVENFERGEADL